MNRFLTVLLFILIPTIAMPLLYMIWSMLFGDARSVTSILVYVLTGAIFGLIFVGLRLLIVGKLWGE
ncbi:hypothetical protein [Geomicrobium sp. JCM 19038]|uniref:hypothetical protein n=1 Tax=Geomicrobium sp. JCM 19038 TaxID=1460635 RepID=UPI00045F1948|nr:hypothetical protein [Geomicrobium sp. JCM 19038]GAK09164.1 hypothetical protein JCM19038_2987 [Geomicrobium sp. JCM 19038]